MQNGYFTQRIGKIISEENDMDIERKPQKHRAIVIDSLLNGIEYEIKEEGEAEDILELIIDIRNTADRIIKLLKGE